MSSVDTVSGSVEREKRLLLSSFNAIRFRLAAQPELLERAVEIASQYSPSASFQKARGISSFYNLSPSEEIAFAKMTRWLAVIRRNYGLDEFKKTADMLRQQVQDVYEKIQSLDDMVMPGIYAKGEYSWLGTMRARRLQEAVKRDTGVRPPAQLALEVFYALYLEDLTHNPVSDPRLAHIANIVSPIESSSLRKYTVGDEILSFIVAKKIVSRIVEKAKEKAQEKNTSPENVLRAVICPKAMQNIGMKPAEAEEIVETVVEEAENENYDNEKKAAQVVEAFGKKAGIGHKITFEDKVSLTELLAKYSVIVDTVLDAIKTYSDKPGTGGGSIELTGYKQMEEYRELPSLVPLELAYPEDVFYKRLLGKELRVRKYEQGPAGRHRRKYIVLIDKSGSMSGDKLYWAKGVALSLLLRPDVDDVKVIFFDDTPYRTIELNRNPKDAITRLVSVKAEGGTSIDRALEAADQYKGYTTVIITDGEDKVTYKPRNNLVAVMVSGHNPDLEKISDKYYAVDPERRKVVLADKL